MNEGPTGGRSCLMSKSALARNARDEKLLYLAHRPRSPLRVLQGKASVALSQTGSAPRCWDFQDPGR